MFSSLPFFLWISILSDCVVLHVYLWGYNVCLLFLGVSLWCSWSLRPEGKPVNPSPPWDALWATMRCCCCSACWCCSPAAWPAEEAQCFCLSHPVTKQSTQLSHTQVSVCRNTRDEMGFLIQLIKFSISFHNCINSPAVCNYLCSVSRTFPISHAHFPFRVSVPLSHFNHLISTINIFYFPQDCCAAQAYSSSAVSSGCFSPVMGRAN